MKIHSNPLAIPSWAAPVFAVAVRREAGLVFRRFPAKSPRASLALLGAALLGWCAPEGARGVESVLLPSVADVRLNEGVDSGSLGAVAGVVVGTQGPAASFARNRGLYRFDPAAAIPGNAVVTAATLKLTVTRIADMGDGDNSTFELRRVLKPWAETEANWVERLSTGEEWDGGGAAEGTDYSSTVSADQFSGGLGSILFSGNPNLAADVQNWLRQPASNFGWLLKSQDEAPFSLTARWFGSRENASGIAPELAVSFVVPARVDDTEIVAGALRIHFQGRAGNAYVVEFRDDLSAGTWTALTNLPIQAVSGEIVVGDPLGAGPRFYRVGAQ